MGSGAVLASMLHRARSGIRVDRLPLLAGHGVVDANFRPARLPYVSVTGPLNLELEPERDPTRTSMLWVQTPGYLAGADRGAADQLPAAGATPIGFVVDGDAEATVDPDLDALAGRSLDDPATGRAVAESLQRALRTAVDGGGFLVGGAPVVDPRRRDELRNITARWDGERNRLVVSSGRRGVMTSSGPAAARSSSIEVLPGALAIDLGLTGVAAVRAPGRVVRHERPAPVAVAVDLRVDLWAETQLDLATVLDAWARITQTRGQLFERPALLATAVNRGDTVVRLQPDGEPATASTLLQLERLDGTFVDRMTGLEAVLAAGAFVDAAGLQLDGNATATLRFGEAPPIPYAWVPERPGRAGYATSLRLMVPGGANGDVLRVAELQHDGQTVLAVSVELATQNAILTGRVRVEGENEAGDPFNVVSESIAMEMLATGVDVHVVLDAQHGVTAFVDASAVGASAVALGSLPGGGAMDLVLGGATPNPLTIVHVQVHGRPLGPLDPRLRTTISTAGQWSPGDSICLARVVPDAVVTGEPFVAEVIAVNGDELTLDRPVANSFGVHATAVYRRALFFSQRQLRRQDDLMNALFRICIEYRVSTYLDEAEPAVSAPLVEVADVDVRDLVRLAAEEANPQRPHHLPRPATGYPGIRTEVVASTLVSSVISPNESVPS